MSVPEANLPPGARARTAQEATSALSERLFPNEAGADEETGQPEGEPETGEVDSQPEGELPDDLEARTDAEETDDDESGEHEADQEGGSEWASLEELLEAGAADVANLKTTITVDGEAIEVSVAELKQGYQREADYRRKTAELSTKARQQEAEQTQRLGAIQQLGQQAQATSVALEQVIQTAEQGVQQQYQHVNWQQLRMEQPAEYSAMWTEYQQAMSNVGGLRKHVEEQIQQSMQASETARQAALHQQHATNQSRLFELMPAWAEEATAKQDGEAMVAYVRQAFPETTSEELKQVDPRMLVCLHKARLYDEMQAQTTALKKQSKDKLLRPVRPGNQGRPLSPKQSQALKEGRGFRAAKQKSAKTGKLNDAAETMAQRLKL